MIWVRMCSCNWRIHEIEKDVFKTFSRRFEEVKEEEKREEEEEEKEEMQTPCAREFGGHGTKNVPGVRGVVEKSRGLFVF